MSGATEDWGAVLDRLISGDRAAFLTVSRLITGLLISWRAFDFEDEWDDLIQDVVIALVTASREGRIRDRGAIAGYVRTTARFKFVDRLRQHIRCPVDEAVPWEDVAVAANPGPVEPEAIDVRRALEKLPPKTRDAVSGVYLRGRTYEQVSKETGIPLGTLKRYLRQGLAELREALGAEGRGDPISTAPTTH